MRVSPLEGGIRRARLKRLRGGDTTSRLQLKHAFKSSLGTHSQMTYQHLSIEQRGPIASRDVQSP